MGAKSATRGLSLPCTFFSHPTAAGLMPVPAVCGVDEYDIIGHVGKTAP